MSARFAGSRPNAVVVHGLAIVLVALMLAGCGKKGSPLPPPGEPNTYPSAYPVE